MTDNDWYSKVVKAGVDDDLIPRTRFFPTSTPAVFDGILLGLVFVVAWWSVPARSHWLYVKKLVREVDPAGKLELVVLDIDGMTGFEDCELGPTVAGAGETTWVRAGKLACPKWVFPSDAVKVNTRLLLEGRELFVPTYGVQMVAPMPPPDLHDRVTDALRSHAAPELGLDPADLTVVEVADGIASVRLAGTCASCPATLPALLMALERVVRERVPEVELLEAVP